MQVENHKEEVPFSYYEEKFQGLVPEDAVARLGGVRWDGEEFYVNLLGREYALAHPAYAIRAVDGGSLPPLPVQALRPDLLLQLHMSVRLQ